MTAAGSSYKGLRFPPEIISRGVWPYHRFPLSFRDVQELMLERGVDVSYETIQAWCDRFGQEYANQLRRRGPRPGDKWHLDEVFVLDQRRTAVPVARGRPARQRARHSGPVAPKRGGRKEVLPPTAHGPALRAQGDPHRPARQLPDGAPRAHGVGAASPLEVPKPRRELSPADPATRAGDETLHLDPARAPVPVRVQRHLAALSAPSAPAVGGDYRQVMADRFAVWNEITGATTTPAASSATGTGRSSKPTAHHPESSHRPIRLAQVDSARLWTSFWLLAAPSAVAVTSQPAVLTAVLSSAGPAADDPQGA